MLGGAGDRGARTGEARPATNHRHQGVKRERLVRLEHLQTARSRAVAYQGAGRDQGSRARDLPVGHAQQNGGITRPYIAATVRPGDPPGAIGELEGSVTERCGELCPQAARADNRQRTWRSPR